MVWFFERENNSLRIETTYDRLAGTFTLNVYEADGTYRTERFSSRSAFQDRLEALEEELLAEHWTQKGASLLRALDEPAAN
jgi:hypothetical protein